MGTPLIAGRDLTWAETYQKRPVALVSENLAREYWGTPENALGKHIRVANTDDWREIIGVAKNVYYDGVSQKAPSHRVLAGVSWPNLKDSRRQCGAAYRLSSARLAPAPPLS